MNKREIIFAHSWIHIIGIGFVALVTLAVGMKLYQVIDVATVTIKSEKNVSEGALRYVPLGDSYTIGEGVPRRDNFPSKLTAELAERGLLLDIVSEPARTGFTTRDLVDTELPVFLRSEPDFTTLLIGVNDWVRGVSQEVYREHVVSILEALLSQLPPSRIVVIAIPDFSATPSGKYFTAGRDAVQGISSFNAIMKEETDARGIELIDIFALSQKQGREEKKEALASDGLHYSGAGYGEWVKLIVPIAEKQLRKE